MMKKTLILLILFCVCFLHARMLPKEPLHMAVQDGDLKKVKALLKKGVEINKLDERFGCTALDLAAVYGRLDIVKVLRRAGAKIYVAKQKEPIVFAAVYSGNVDLLKFLLSEGADSKSRNKEGENLLHSAITWRHKDMVLYLINIKVDVNAKDKKGNTPLHTVAWIGNLRVTSELVKAGANVNAVNNHKETPLCLATIYNHIQVIEDLISAKADCNILDRSGGHPLFHANSLEAMKLLLKAGVKPDISDKCKYTPLSVDITARNGKELVECLLKAGANVNKRIDHGRTAIFNTIPDDKVEIFQILVANGAKLDVKSDSGETPLDWIEKYNAKKIRNFLKNKTKDK